MHFSRRDETRAHGAGGNVACAAVPSRDVDRAHASGDSVHGNALRNRLDVARYRVNEPLLRPCVVKLDCKGIAEVACTDRRAA